MPVYVSLTSRVAVSFRVWLVVILSPYRTDHDDGRITELCEHLREPNSHQVQNSSEGVAPRRTRVFQCPFLENSYSRTLGKDRHSRQPPEASPHSPPRPTLANPCSQTSFPPRPSLTRLLPASGQAGPVQIKNRGPDPATCDLDCEDTALQPVLFQMNHLFPYFSF